MLDVQVVQTEEPEKPEAPVPEVVPEQPEEEEVEAPVDAEGPCEAKKLIFNELYIYI